MRAIFFEKLKNANFLFARGEIIIKVCGNGFIAYTYITYQ